MQQANEDLLSGDLLQRVDGRVGRITLNRPDAINALTPAMLHSLSAALTDWAENDRIEAVVLDGAGARGLCAGGDIRLIASMSAPEAARFWREEYAVDLQTSRFPKPYVAIMDGITMGGGVGISAHGSVRIVTERSRVAMPEVRIGLAPDVGGSLLLARAPGELGTHLGLTAGTMTGPDAILCGFADHYVNSAKLESLRAALGSSAEKPEAVVQGFAERPPAAPLEEHREWIDACYSSDSVPDILDRLASSGSDRAASARSDILAMSPTSVVVTLAAIRRADLLGSLDLVLEQDLRVSTALFARPDLAEGIRAQVVDKDRSPRWTPATIDEVRLHTVRSILGTDRLSIDHNISI
ncbi:enoyl-CoA hydratase/isomerase family protein [Mycetocola miduiensis]|uniref:3-hydroxyisobutyryl-CoA hydrolase n=1 Tax=Mycetocola miduiensis TaxID=995034 RepID=A0A1I5B218_9MICO|nr:enoyl-CoA hydratase/isomerase family protein [Mycetocola miduiensis]SFN68661.1 enoyl-CoA hydratase [Mycetocola miduiensis]